jgi:hypothetical protein
MLQVPERYWPARQEAVQLVQAVIMPVRGWNEPAGQPRHWPVKLVRVQVTSAKVPGPQEMVQALHAVCAPSVSWYDCGPHGRQVGVVVVVHEPLRNSPAAHADTQVWQLEKLLTVGL